MHLRTTGVPGQGVDCRLLRLVINSPGPDPPPADVFAIWLRLRQNVLRQKHGRFEPRTVQPATPRNQTGYRGPPLRRHIGLENVDDLKADLERGFAALKAAAWAAIPVRFLSGLRGGRCSGVLSLASAGPDQPRVVVTAASPDFCGQFSSNDNRSFTMTANPAVGSTKTFTPQVPLYL
jgi:hypothetical protein